MTAIVLLLSLLLLLLLFWPLLTRLLLVAAFWLSRATCAWQGRLADGVPSTCSQHQAQQQFSSSPPPGFRMTFAGRLAVRWLRTRSSSAVVCPSSCAALG